MSECRGCGSNMKKDQTVEGGYVLVGYSCNNKQCPDYEVTV